MKIQKILAVGAGLFLSAAGLADSPQEHIRAVTCAPHGPAITLEPLETGKGSITFVWNARANEWWWLDPWSGKLEAVPTHYFGGGDYGWYVEQERPYFGRRERWLLGLGAKLSIWHWTGSAWTGGTPAPTTKTPAARVEQDKLLKKIRRPENTTRS